MSIPEQTCRIPTLFTRQHHRLYALLLENQVWLCAHHLGHNERPTQGLLDWPGQPRPWWKRATQFLAM